MKITKTRLARFCLSALGFVLLAGASPSLAVLVAQPSNAKTATAYDYPIKPGIPEWAALKTEAPTRPLSLVVEQGHVLPTQVLLNLNCKGAAPSCPSLIKDISKLSEPLNGHAPFEVTFMILQGSARFQSGKSGNGTVVSTAVADGVVKLPALVPSARVYDESFIGVNVNGKIIFDKLRLATLPTGGIENLLRYVSTTAPALIALGEHYAVIDEDKWNITSSETVTFTHPEPNLLDKSSDGGIHLLGICIRTPFGPGWVNWGIPNPAGAGWSYKPENAFNLLWATAPDDAIDAVYNRSWGCGIALKIPDSCTVSEPSGNTCCNAALAAAGYVPQFVNPIQHGFPNCPL